MILYKTPFKPQTLIAGDVLAYEVKSAAIAHVVPALSQCKCKQCEY